MKTEHRVPKWTKPENIRWAAWGWDHLTYYRRLGASGAPFWGDTGWLEKWWARLHDEKALDQIAELGVNVLITHFFKGMGMETEKTMLDDLRRLVALCRPRRIRLIGYTFGTIFSETFVKEVPEAADWAARWPNGERRPWSGSYYRWSPCLNSGYYDYLLKLVEFGAKDVGLNGFHFDNSYAVACYCERCRKKFQEYLEARFATPERFGFTGFSHVSPPPETGPRDPLKQEWLRFRTLSLAEKMEGIYRHIKAIDPDLAVLSNPAFPRRANWADQLGVNPLLFGRWHDLMFAENANFPSVSNGEMVSQARAYAFGDSIGYGVVASCWPRSKKDEHTLPERESQAVLSILEPAVFGHAPGTTWACRSTKGDAIALDRPPLRDGARKTFAFLNARRDLFAGAIAPAKVGLLHAFESFAFAHDRLAPAYDGFERFLSLKGVPYRIVFTEEPERFADYKYLIVSSQVCLSDAVVRALLAFVKNGGKLVLTGASGERNENLLTREENPFVAALASPNVLYLPEAPETIPGEVDSSGKWMERHTWTLPPRHAELSAALEKAFGEAFFPLRLAAPATVSPVLKALPDGRNVLHLLNYDESSTANVKLTFGALFDGKTTCRVHRLDGASVATAIGPDRTLEIRNLNLYAGVEL